MTTQQRQNLDYADRFDQAGAIHINKMFWIAGSYDSSELKDMLQDDMSIKDWQTMLPEIDTSLLEEYLDDEQPMSIFTDYNKRGFIAETHYPEHRNFTYKNGKITGCSISSGICSIDFVYAETIEELMINIEKVAAENYKRCIASDKKKKAAPKD